MALKNKLLKTSEHNNDGENVQARGHAPQLSDYNPYYASVSTGYRYAKIICVFVLSVYILFCILVFGESLTYDNARYVLRDLGQILTEDQSTPVQQITLNVDADMDYGIYRGSVVVGGMSGVDIYSPSGTHKLSDKSSYSSPVVLTSEKYCIVYSLGAYNLSVYNTVARVYDLKFDHPIYDVALSDDGYFAVMTQSKEYKSVVYLYDPDFSLVATYNKSEYPCSVEISDADNSLFISVFGSESGHYVTDIFSYPLRSDTPAFSVNISGVFPYDIVLFADGGSALISDSKTVFISKDGNVASEYSYDSSITSYYNDDDSISFLLSKSTPSIITLSSVGECVFETLSEDALDIYRFDGKIVVGKNDSIQIFSSDSDKDITLPRGMQKILYNDNYLFVCYQERILPMPID